MGIIRTEPAAVSGVIVILLNVLVSFGLKLTVDQIALLNTLVVAVLALFVRQSTTPVAQPSLPAGTTVEVITPPGEANTSATL